MGVDLPRRGVDLRRREVGLLRRRLLLILVVAGLLSVVACRKTPPPTAPPVEPAPASTLGRPDCAQDFAACLKDADCVQIANGCCSCAMGGDDTAINRACREAWLQKQGDCSETVCTAVFRCDELQKPRCIQNRCVLAGEPAASPAPLEPPPEMTPAAGAPAKTP